MPWMVMLAMARFIHAQTLTSWTSTASPVTSALETVLLTRYPATRS